MGKRQRKARAKAATGDVDQIFLKKISNFCKLYIDYLKTPNKAISYNYRIEFYHTEKQGIINDISPDTLRFRAPKIDFFSKQGAKF